MTLTQEDLAKHIKIATQNAWRQDNGGATTLNSMVEYIIRESLAVVMEVLLEQETKITQLEQRLEELTNGKNGGLPQPQGNQKAAKSIWGNAESKPHPR